MGDFNINLHKSSLSNQSCEYGEPLTTANGTTADVLVLGHGLWVKVWGRVWVRVWVMVWVRI